MDYFLRRRRRRSTPPRDPKPEDGPRNRPTSEPHFPTMDSGDGLATGLVLQDCYVPEEILRLILSFVDPKSLLQCRAVCKYWRHEVDNEVWKFIARRDHCLGTNAINTILNTIPNSWWEFYLITTNKPFGQNLLRNNSGQDELNNWDVLSNGGDKWAVENPPVGTENLPDEVVPSGSSNCCFVTSFHSCSKQQTICLERCGLTARLMDRIRLNIHVSEWYARRFDCGAVYEMKVQLLNGEHEVLKDFEFRITMDEGYGSDWHEVSHEFKDYGPGVRYISFYHGGMDTQFWAGHYGSKMARASVIVSMDPASTSTLENDEMSSVSSRNISV